MTITNAVLWLIAAWQREVSSSPHQLVVSVDLMPADANAPLVQEAMTSRVAAVCPRDSVPPGAKVVAVFPLGMLRPAT